MTSSDTKLKDFQWSLRLKHFSAIYEVWPGPYASSHPDYIGIGSHGQLFRPFDWELIRVIVAFRWFSTMTLFSVYMYLASILKGLRSGFWGQKSVAKYA